MAKIVVSYPGERVVSEITALVRRPATPSVVEAPHIGLVQIGEVQPTELIPGPPGAQGPRGSRWFTGDGPPAGIPGVVTGDMYLDDLTDQVWAFDGTTWVDTGTNIHGSPDTGADILGKLAPVDGSGSGLDADMVDGEHAASLHAWANLTGKPATFPPTLPIAQSDVTNLVTDQTAQNTRLTNVETKNTAQDSSIAAIESVNATQTTNISNNAAAIATETTNRTNADNALQTQINTKIGDAPNDGLTYGRKSLAWATIVGGAVVSDTAPLPPLQNGQLWHKSDTGDTFIYVIDPSGPPGQWVQQNVASNLGGKVNAVFKRTAFAASTSTFAFDPMTSFADVECLGGGGGGGGAPTTTAGQASAGSGGGGGGYCKKLIRIIPGLAPVLTIGAGGAGAGTSAGATGGATTYSDGTNSLTANGGNGGNAGVSSNLYITRAGAFGGGSSGGDFNTRGANGHNSISIGSTIATGSNAMGSGGYGGMSMYGGGGTGAITNTTATALYAAGTAGLSYGGGGGGALAVNAGTPGANTGGDGTQGVIIITEYR